jgi:antitoxin (DNA-binding transcriptional repressor) of toxin-antitoxin stability system
MHVANHAAKTKLSDLIQAALGGEEAIVANGDKPVVKLAALPKAQYKLGELRGQWPPPLDSFFAPLTREQLAGWESGLAAMFSSEDSKRLGV